MQTNPSKRRRKGKKKLKIHGKTRPALKKKGNSTNKQSLLKETQRTHSFEDNTKKLLTKRIQISDKILQERMGTN